jgi:phosphoribosylaminoimidazolecarboxamide formyltransferase/IMP cyclohydrolase
MTRTALISVYDKTGVIAFAKGLEKNGFRIISTGGTAHALKDAGVSVTGVSEFTGFPEVFGGRVKTLHPAVFGGILFRSSSKTDRNQAETNKISRIDLVAVNLYPFEEVAAKTPFNEKYLCADAIESIDVGGLAMLRAAAKNFEDVVAICDPADYGRALETITSGKDDAGWRLSLAAKVFRYTAYYDSVIARYFSGGALSEKFPMALKKISSLRYGENPHQKAALYAIPLSEGITGAKQLQGKELSYNNYLDLDAAWTAVSEFPRDVSSACVIVKHANPCGAAESAEGGPVDAYRRALLCDPTSAFGGIVAFNRPVDGETAAEVVRTFTECVVALSFSEEAKKIFSAKKDLRLMETAVMPGAAVEMRSVSGGVLVQDKDIERGIANLKVVARRQPEDAALESLKFAWKIAKNVKSNAIVLAQGRQTTGIGAGQMSRIDSIRIAAKKMGLIKLPLDVARLPVVMASDAFFPFRDVVDLAAKVGVSAIIQPGGSLKDDESINACDEYGIAMVFTGVRHFRH